MLEIALVFFHVKVVVVREESPTVHTVTNSIYPSFFSATAAEQLPDEDDRDAEQLTCIGRHTRTHTLRDVHFSSR